MLTTCAKAYSSSCSQTVRPFCLSSFIECALQWKIAKKIIIKTPYFRSSESFKVIDVDATEKPVTVCLL